MNMQEEELRQLLRSHGWNLLVRERQGKKRDSAYLLAQKWGMPQVYISSRKYLPIIDQTEVLEKIKAISS